MAVSDYLWVAGALVGAYILTRPSTVTALETGLNVELSGSNEPSGVDHNAIADRLSGLSDAVRDQVRNEERFAGSPVSPYQ